MAVFVPVENLDPFRFALDDTFEMIDKQNGQIDAMNQIVANINVTIGSMNDDVEAVIEARNEVVNVKDLAVADINIASSQAQAAITNTADLKLSEIDDLSAQSNLSIQQTKNTSLTEINTLSTDSAAHLADLRDASLSQINVEKDNGLAELTSAKTTALTDIDSARDNGVSQIHLVEDQARASLLTYADTRQTEFDQTLALAQAASRDSETLADRAASSADDAFEYMKVAQQTVTGGAAISALAPPVWLGPPVDGVMKVNTWYQVESSVTGSLTMPTLPGEGDMIHLLGALKGLTLNYNGRLILGLAEPLEIDVDVTSLSLVFTGGSWKVMES